MKFSNRQIIAILAILIAGVLAAHRYAPGAVAEITSITATVIGVLFVNRDKDPPGPSAGGTGSPDLKVIAGGLGVLVIGCAVALAGCLHNHGQIEDVTVGPDVSANLAKCRNVARTVYYVGGRPVEEALSEYERCKARAGLK